MKKQRPFDPILVRYIIGAFISLLVGIAFGAYFQSGVVFLLALVAFFVGNVVFLRKAEAQKRSATPPKLRVIQGGKSTKRNRRTP